MLDDKFLEKWVPVIIPEKYGPDRELENNKPLLCVTLYKNERMNGYRDDFYPDLKDSEVQLRGHILNMGRFMEFAGVDDFDRFIDRYLIKINSDLTEEAGIYALAHEAGHLHGFITKDPNHELDPDEFADNFALKRCKEVISDPLLAINVMLEGLSNTYKYY